MLRNDYALVSVRLQSQVSFELRLETEFQEVATGKQLQATAKIAHLGYVLMPYRLDAYDAMASLALTSDASTNRRSVATPTPSGVHLGGVERRP